MLDGHVKGGAKSISTHQFVFFQSMLLLVAQGSLVKIDDVLAVFWIVVLRRPVIRCLVNRKSTRKNG